MPKGAIFKVKCKKQSYLMITRSFLNLGVFFPHYFRTTSDRAKLWPHLESAALNLSRPMSLKSKNGKKKYVKKDTFYFTFANFCGFDMFLR